MARASNVLERMREICLSLPDTQETPTWGKPHFRVGDKIFAGCGEEPGGPCSIGFKLEMEHAAGLVARDPRFTRAPYVGHKGWVSMDASGIRDWDEVRELVLESYSLIAPRRTLRLLEASGAGGAAPAAPARKKATARRPAAAAKAAAAKAATAPTRRRPPAPSSSAKAAPPPRPASRRR